MDMVIHRFNDRIREDLARISLDKRETDEKTDRDRKAAMTANMSPVVSADETPGDTSPQIAQTGESPERSSDDTHFATA
jgi:hypothetical protein